MQFPKNFKVNRSSAGSGKTYILALNFISLSLVGANKFSESYYKKILALTFTNKAANEMKDRVLEYLEYLSNRRDKDGILDWIVKETNLSEEKIYELSKRVKTHILHNYADLRISTIDKFTYNIVRTFAADLGLSYNFDLELDNYKIIKPVVSTLLSSISGNGKELSELLVNFALQKAEDGKSTNIEFDLEEFSKNLFKEEAIPFINSNTNSVADCILIKDELYNKKKQIVAEIKDLSNSSILFFNTHGFQKEHFIRGTFYNHFTKNLQDSNDSKWIPSETLSNNIISNFWYTKSKSKEIKQLVESHKSNLIYFYDQLINLLKEYHTVQSLLANIYSIALLNELLVYLNEYKQSKNIEQISVFNQKINDIIVQQPSSFIYERIGERYNHFLIDEFQDTSLLQWQNMLPLITDSIDYGTCLIVGDSKQSIYRWRGGEVQQFIEIPQIFKGKDLIYKKEWESKLKLHYQEDKNENHNYRSKKEIIKFNNDFFRFLSSKLSDDLQNIYDKCSQKYDKAPSGGYVHMELVTDAINGFEENVLQNIVEEIHKLKSENKFQNKDICILCNSRKKVSLVAERLSEEGIKVISNEGLLIGSSNKIRVIIAIMYFLLDKDNILSKTVIINFLRERESILSNPHKINLQLLKDEGFNKLLDQFNIKIIPNKLLALPLYETVENIYRILDINEDVYTSFFLDLVLRFTEKNGSNMADFVEWWEEVKEKESIVIPEGIDAVQVMTIHKSKGLAFDVVMIPFNWESRKRYNEMWVDSSTYTSNKLKSALIRGGKKLDLSHFSYQYQREKELMLMDNLNKLYVAMTRAVSRLYIFAKEYPKNLNDNFKNSGKLNSFLYMYGVEEKLIKGNHFEKNLKKETKDEQVFNCSISKKINWKNLISLKKSSVISWDIDSQRSNKEWGKLLHFALSKIKYKKDFDHVIKNIFLEGLCNAVEKDRLRNEIIRLLSDKDLSKFFEDKWDVKNEKEILTNNGKSYIPDRLLFSQDRIVVIDYKTGNKNDIHIDQISNYGVILEEMGYTNIEKYLVYTNQDKLVYKI